VEVGVGVDEIGDVSRLWRIWLQGHGFLQRKSA
jgi:hypothetical protein